MKMRLSSRLKYGVSAIAVATNFTLASTAALLMTGAVSTTAQAEDYTTGTVSGIIRNTAGTAVANASIIIKSDKGISRSASTNAEGRFRFPLLPIGKYAVNISKADYDDFSSDNITVSLGSSGEYTFTINSTDNSMEEVYVVGTRQGSWDFNSTTTGITVNVDDLFERTPIGRDSTSVALLAPGTGQGDGAFTGGDGSSLASFSGSSVGENVYYVNGLNVTNFRTFTGGSTIPFEFYEQMEIKTGGYQAEFGRSTGGVINAVTKSGSNEFHFGANVIWQPDWATKDRPATTSSANQLDVRERLEYNFWASGPIVKDKLFFFGLYNPRNVYQEDVYSGQKDVFVKNSPFYGLKIDYAPFEGHHIDYTFFQDTQNAVTDTYNVNGWPSFSSTTPVADREKAIGAVTSDQVGSKIGTTYAKSGGINHIFKYTGNFTDWFSMSVLYGINKFNRTTQSSTDNNPVIYDGRGGSLVTLGNWANFQVETGEDKREAWRIDGDLFFNAMGDHHIRFGWDRENLTATNYSKYSGGAYYRYYTLNGTESPSFVANANALGVAIGNDYVRVRDYVNGGILKTIQTALYIQDSWQILDNLTINLGLRNETFDNRNANGKTFVKASNQIAWRTGFTWDPTEESNSRVYGSYGRYYLPIATNTNVRMASSEVFTADWYPLLSLNADDTPNYNTADLIQHVTYGDGTIQPPDSLKDANLSPMYQDEFILGYEHNFDEWTVGIRGIYRKLGSLIEDVAIDAAVNKWAAANGLDSSAYSGFHQYVLTNPGQDLTTTTNGILDSNGNPADQVVTLSAKDLGYPKGQRTYKAIEITFSREWDGKWSLDGSYTWSESKGNYEGSVKSDNGQDDAGITTDFDQPGLTDGAYGLLPNHRSHRMKVWGAYAVEDWLTIGGKFTVESPRKQGCIGVHPTDIFASLYGRASWYCGGKLTPRGTQMQTDWQTTLDLSATIIPGFNDEIKGEISFRIDVFNVFNSHYVTKRSELDHPVLYGSNTVYSRPRYVRFMANYKF